MFNTESAYSPFAFPRAKRQPKRPANGRYPEEVKTEAIRLLQRSRMTVEEIGARLGIKVSALRGWACERMISLRWRSESTRHDHYFRISDRDRAVCEVMLSNIVPLAELAEHFNLTREGIRQIGLRWGIYHRRPRA